MPLVAVAGGAVSGIEGRGAAEVGGTPGSGGHLVGPGQLTGQLAGAGAHDLAGGLVLDGLAQFAGLGQQTRLFGVVGEGGEVVHQFAGEFHLFGVFEWVGHLAVFHGAGVVHREVVEGVQHPAGVGGQGGEGAQEQQDEAQTAHGGVPDQ